MQAIQDWHDTRIGYVTFGVVEFMVSILFGSLAINSGSLWQWALTLIFLAGFVQNIGRLTIKMFHKKITDTRHLLSVKKYNK